ncbi:MAG: hypothetical protein RBS99_16280 [Rhodospirillales bacterium]|nr:hypothetical protein [Rhodospirillales bacterium]
MRHDQEARNLARAHRDYIAAAKPFINLATAIHARAGYTVVLRPDRPADIVYNFHAGDRRMLAEIDAALEDLRERFFSSISRDIASGQPA